MITKLFFWHINIILFLLSYIIPKKKGHILFSSSFGEAFRGNPKYLYLYMFREYEKEKCLWITRKKKIVKELRSRGYRCVSVFNIKGFFSILRSEYIVVDTYGSKDFSYLDPVLGNFKIIQTWHGTPIKKIGFSYSDRHNKRKKINKFLFKKQFKTYIFVTATSKEVARRLSNAFLNKNVKVIGSPRNDVLFDRRLVYNDLNKIFEFTKYSKVISYLPTWRDINLEIKPFTQKGLEDFNKYLKKNNMLFVFKKHPSEQNFPKIKKLSNIKDLSNEIEDVQELLIHTNILITDYSGVSFDFSLLHKPIIFYPYDYKEYLDNCREMYNNYYLDIPGPFAKNEKDVFKLIKNEKEWFEERSYQKKYNQFKKKFNKYTDGKSSVRLFNEILKYGKD